VKILFWKDGALTEGRPGEPRLQTAACVWAKGNVAPVAVLSEGLGRGVSTVKTLQSEYQRD